MPEKRYGVDGAPDRAREPYYDFERQRGSRS